MRKSNPERCTVDLTAYPDLVVIYLGMLANNLRGLWTLLRTGPEIDRAVAELPDDQREVFLMREVMEMPFAEIASAVGVSEPTVKSRMRYALEKLRAALADLGDTGAGAAESTGSG